MPTAVVSARVDEQVRDRAARYIRAAGMTPGDVIKTVWQEIATTGVVPRPREKSCDSSAEVSESFRRFMDLRSSLPARPELAKLEDAQMRALVASRYE